MAMNYNYSLQSGYHNSSQPVQQFFPQPQGNVYFINNSLEVANVPMSGGGVSVAICIPENLVYLKSMNNGTPYFQAYTLTPYENKTTPNTQQEISDLSSFVKELGDKIQKLEQLISLKPDNKGGAINEF